MDDTPDKLRRNVVVLAAAILTIACFHLSFKPTGTLLGFAEVGNVSAFKVWVALTVVLGYMFLRYRFHGETGTELSVMLTHYSGLRYAALGACLVRDARLCFLGHRAQSHYVPDFEMMKYETFRQPISELGPPTTLEITPSVERLPDLPWTTGKVSYGVLMCWGDAPQRGLNSVSPHVFRLPSLEAARIVTWCAFRTATYSKSAVDVLVPFVLAGLAMLVCLYKVALFFPL